MKCLLFLKTLIEYVNEWENKVQLLIHRIWYLLRSEYCGTLTDNFTVCTYIDVRSWGHEYWHGRYNRRKRKRYFRLFENFTKNFRPKKYFLVLGPSSLTRSLLKFYRIHRYPFLIFEIQREKRKRKREEKSKIAEKHKLYFAVSQRICL